MKVILIPLLWLACGWAAAAGISPCVLKPSDLAPVLGHLPLDGHAERDPLGVPMCVYEMKGESGRRFLVLVHAQAWDRKRFAQRVALAEGSGMRKVQSVQGVGDAAFFVEGVAGTLAGQRYVELNGLKTAAVRQVQPDEVAALLKLALERLPKS
jgi:hypothetical protein